MIRRPHILTIERGPGTMTDNSKLDRHYPNAPLLEVAGEVRFPGEVAVESNRHLFWDQIREQYPQVLVPAVAAGDHVALKAYRYRSSSGDRSVAVAINSLSLSENRYTTHETFMTCYPKIATASRIGWRYINAIPFVRSDDGTAPVSQFFLPNFGILKGMGPNVKNFSLSLQAPRTDGEAAVKLSTATDARNGQEAFLLDIDCCVTGADLIFGSALEHLANAHSVARQVFEGLITDSYRQYLRGEAI
jgi:uncharacterized protein (TIGR04255 family)